MKIKIDKIVKKEHLLNIYIKFPFYRRYKDYAEFLKQFEDNENYNFMNPCLDVDGKHIIMTFVLRNKKDIEPYIKYGINKDLCKEIYERLNEIQYLLKFTLFGWKAQVLKAEVVVFRAWSEK